MAAFLWNRAYCPAVGSFWAAAFPVHSGQHPADLARVPVGFPKREGVDLTPLAFPPGAAVLEGEGSPAALPEFQEGLFHVQDLSAQVACQLLEVQPGQNICDCCAALGGRPSPWRNRWRIPAWSTPLICTKDVWG